MKNWIAIIALTFTAGCSTLGVSTPETFNEKLAVSYGTVTAVRQTATTLLNANKITVNDAQNAQEVASTARTGLDVARSISKTDLNAANARLNAVRASLTAIQTYLASRSK